MVTRLPAMVVAHLLNVALVVISLVVLIPRLTTSFHGRVVQVDQTCQKGCSHEVTLDDGSERDDDYAWSASNGDVLDKQAGEFGFRRNGQWHPWYLKASMLGMLLVCGGSLLGFAWARWPRGNADPIVDPPRPNRIFSSVSEPSGVSRRLLLQTALIEGAGVVGVVVAPLVLFFTTKSLVAAFAWPVVLAVLFGRYVGAEGSLSWLRFSLVRALSWRAARARVTGRIARGSIVVTWYKVLSTGEGWKHQLHQFTELCADELEIDGTLVRFPLHPTGGPALLRRPSGRWRRSRIEHLPAEVPIARFSIRSVWVKRMEWKPGDRIDVAGEMIDAIPRAGGYRTQGESPVIEARAIR